MLTHNLLEICCMKASSTHASIPDCRRLVFLMAVTIFASAFLLFQVQPLISKLILPWFGGSPTVWTTAMLFFQCVLFAGYAYAHYATRSIAPRSHLCFHLALIGIAAIFACFVVPSAWFKPNGDENPAMRILLLLAVSIGLPYFTLASTGPLLQAWFSRVQPGRSPYRLYSLSNIGSFLALLSFPYLFEPNLDLPQIARGWTVLFWVFAIACGSVALGMLRRSRTEAVVDRDVDAVTPAEHESTPTWITRSAWIGLPALASLTMIAVTDHVSHHIAPEPRLWITTLGLYLLTFIITFDHPRWYQRRWVGIATLASILVLSTYSSVLDWFSIDWGGGVQVERWSHCIVMFLICFLCHGELIRLRPQSHHYLTEFYLCISAGGALGGLFASFVAVTFFSDYYEWPMCLCLAILLGSWTACEPSATESTHPARRIWLSLGLAGLLLGAYVYWEDPFDWKPGGDDEFLDKIVYRERNFYGVLSVEDREHRTDPDRSYRGFYCGNVTHGLQMQSEHLKLRPTTYYGPQTGVGEAIAYLQQRQHSLRIAVVGLGAGTIAAYGRESDFIDFYEINPGVIRIAKEYFTFLRDCKSKTELILGDARLKMEGQPNKQYDLIVLDAYSGGSVPIHLLTREAFAMYRYRLAPKGLIAAHITNSYLNLYPVVKLQAENLGMAYRCKFMARDRETQTRQNLYFIMTYDSEFIRSHPSVFPPKYDANDQVIGTEEPKAPAAILWTDHFSSINPIERKD